MEKNDISINLSVRDIKYNSIATILSLCKVKINGEWKQGVIYTEIDRYTRYPTLFVKSIDEFINSFNVIKEQTDESKEK